MEQRIAGRVLRGSLEESEETLSQKSNSETLVLVLVASSVHPPPTCESQQCRLVCAHVELASLDAAYRRSAGDSILRSVDGGDMVGAGALMRWAVAHGGEGRRKWRAANAQREKKKGISNWSGEIVDNERLAHTQLHEAQLLRVRLPRSDTVGATTGGSKLSAAVAVSPVAG